MTDQGRRLFNMIIAVLVTIAAWVFVVTNYRPMTNVTYVDVPITYTGLVSLANRGYAVADANHDSVEVTLQQKRVDTGSISAEDIKVTADVSSLSTGDNTVTLSVSGPDGTQVDEVSLKTVTVNIESADSEEMPISVEYTDKAGDGEEAVITDMSVAYANVIATEERLAEIDRVAAVIDPEDLSEKERQMTIPLAALDKEGKEVINVMIDPETVSFKAAAGYKKKAALSVTVKDDSDDNYERTYTAPNSVIIKGSKSLIDSTGSITTNEIDISYIYEDTQIPIEYVLPEGIYISNDQKEQLLTVKVSEKEDTEDDSETDDEGGSSN